MTVLDSIALYYAVTLQAKPLDPSRVGSAHRWTPPPPVQHRPRWSPRPRWVISNLGISDNNRIATSIITITYY